MAPALGILWTDQAVAAWLNALEKRPVPSVHGTSGPYRFFFFSFDCAEPKHVHAERDGHLCKSWLQPIALASNSGFRRHELNEIRQLSARHAPLILQAWEQHCGRADDT